MRVLHAEEPLSAFSQAPPLGSSWLSAFGLHFPLSQCPCSNQRPQCLAPEPWADIQTTSHLRGNAMVPSVGEGLLGLASCWPVGEGSPGHSSPNQRHVPPGGLVEMSWGCSPAPSTNPSCQPSSPEVIMALATWLRILLRFPQ